MNKSDVKQIVVDEIDKFVNNALDKEIKKVLSKSNSQSRGETVAIIKDAMDSVYRTLWQKRDFWQSSIK